MRLSSVALFGFKSFADRTEIQILSGITAIVGPNGCGKTNIADALRWALGEQSPRALRGHRMEDVIFHGSTSRRPLGFAEALLTFSNDGEGPVPWSEGSVGRRLLRVRDVMDEVKRQLASLERQAKKAKQYKALQAERRALELALLAGEYVLLVEEEAILAEREGAASQRAEVLETRAATVGAEQEVVRAETMAAEHRAADLRHARDRAELELEGALSQAEQLRRAEEEGRAELARLTEEA